MKDKLRVSASDAVMSGYAASRTHISSVRDRRRRQDTDDRVMQAVSAYIGYCFVEMTAPRVKELAERIGISRTRLTRTVKRCTGQPVKTILRLATITRAAALLQSAMRVVDIVKVLGFGSLRDFRRTFKAVTGVTPSRYKRTTCHLVRYGLKPHIDGTERNKHDALQVDRPVDTRGTWLLLRIEDDGTQG